MQYAHINGFLIAFVLALFIVPAVRRVCLKKGLVDMPNERKVHKNPIPRLGGVAIWLCTILTFVILVFINWDYPYGNGLSGILVGGSIMFLLGLVDDLYDLSPKFKLVVQIGAALIAFLLGVRIEILFNPFGGALHLGILSLPITLIWLVGISNAMNFIDGVDGLAGGVSAICAVTLAVVAIYTNQPISAVLASILAGSMMGFLVFNFHPARIFMGDSGALFSGFVLAGLSVAGVLKSLTATMLLPILILVVPIMDISFSVFRRLLKGSNPMKADAEHIHHKLLKAGFSHNRTAAILYLVCAGAGSVAAILVGAQRVYLTILVIVLILMLLLSRLAKLRKGQELDKLPELQEPPQEEFQV
ncbi:MAG TPA: undecaprenyl-phosphate alpha-N-acetylglucosaminyl 1-phosphate transferase [Cyanobacteria bacterium UBA9971]|nr:undecaprenyl-phosphate alpha-N-acetylglucosaminyl 1-phosphate transferase [Cyanobacteria bacterium UBA9971]